MPTYLGWNVITMPSTPAAPASFDFTFNDAVAVNMSPFTGQQQIQYWGILPCEMGFSLPPMPPAVAGPWVQFVKDIQGMRNVFQFPSAVQTAYASTISAKYWRLKENPRLISVSEMRVYGLHLQLIEAL